MPAEPIGRRDRRLCRRDFPPPPVRWLVPKNKSHTSIQSLPGKNTSTVERIFEKTTNHLHFWVEPSAEGPRLRYRLVPHANPVRWRYSWRVLAKPQGSRLPQEPR